jgi:hypothetical protein
MSTAVAAPATPSALGYREFTIGQFTFTRDEYFAHIRYPGGRHVMPIDAFLPALMRDVAWGFFYGTVNFDAVFGTVNHYGTVEMFVGLFNEAYRLNNRYHVETFEAPALKQAFEAILEDWTHDGDPGQKPITLSRYTNRSHLPAKCVRTTSPPRIVPAKPLTDQCEPRVTLAAPSSTVPRLVAPPERRPA